MHMGFAPGEIGPIAYRIVVIRNAKSEWFTMGKLNLTTFTGS